MKKLIAFLTVAIMLLSMGTFCFAATFAITTNPAVFIGGSFYNIVWATNKDEPAIGYVEYVYGGQTIRVYDEEQGIVRTDDYVHTVSIPKDELDAAGGYTVTSYKVTARSAYNVTLGDSATATRSFIGYHGQEQINIWTFSDIHRTPTGTIMRGVNLCAGNLKGGSPDIVSLNGDIANNLANKDYAVIGVFDTAAQLTGGTIPCLYVRGNHETRGNFASYLLQYLPSDTGELYFKFTYGPMSSIVLDMGEDKIDTHYEYKEQTNYEDYRRQETDWLNSLDTGFDGTPTYRIAFCHGPNIKSHFKYNWLDYLSAWGCDMMVTGHYHEVKWWVPGDTSDMCTDFPIFCEGSHVDNSGFRGGQLLLNSRNIHYFVTNDSGENLLEGNLAAGQNLKAGQTMGEGLKDAQVTAQESEPEIKKTEKETAVAGASPDFGFTCKPTVLDTGDTYTVAIATTAGTDSVCDVLVQYDDRELRFSDHESGAVRSGSNLHGVRIPKKYLDGCDGYEVVAKKVTAHSSMYATLGTRITTGIIPFSGYSGQSVIKMLQISALSTDPSQFARVRAAASDYDILVVNGDMISNLSNSQNIADELLYRTGLLSGGKIPVVFVRGETETFGEYAPYFSWTVRNSTREYYEKIEYGPISILVLDTAGLYPDDSTLYGGLANFEVVRKKQAKWLAGQSYGDATYKLAVSHAAVLYDNVGYRFSRYLNTLGTDLALFAHSAVSSVEELGSHNQNYVSVIGGTYAGDSTVATLLTFNGGNINVKRLGTSGAVLAQYNFNVTDNDATSYTDVSSDKWYASAVEFASAQRIMLGTSEGEFSPDDTLTRAQAVTALARIADADLTAFEGKPSFSDVPADAYYASSVAWAKENGVTFGTGGGKFSPDGALTREMLCAMIYRFANGKYAEAADCSFTDFGSVSEYARPAVSALAAAGLINGVGGGRFAPKERVTRAQLAQIIMNGDL